MSAVCTNAKEQPRTLSLVKVLEAEGSLPLSGELVTAPYTDRVHILVFYVFTILISFHVWLDPPQGILFRFSN
jgi:hypothetical protein